MKEKDKILFDYDLSVGVYGSPRCVPDDINEFTPCDVYKTSGWRQKLKKKKQKKIVCFVCVFKSQPPVPAPLAVPSFSSVFVSTSKKNDDSDKCLVIITDPCVCVSSTICFLSLPPSFGCVASLFPFSNWNDSLLVSTKTQLRQHQFIVRRRKRTRTDERGKCFTCVRNAYNLQ